jgi:hypothetical protein
MNKLQRNEQSLQFSLKRFPFRLPQLFTAVLIHPNLYESGSSWSWPTLISTAVFPQQIEGHHKASKGRTDVSISPVRVITKFGDSHYH